MTSLINSFRSSLFSWLGILGAVLTLFSNFQTLIEIADWAKFLIEKWSYFINRAWEYVFSWLNFNVDIGTRFQMSMALSMLLIGLGAYFSKKSEEYDTWRIKASNIIRWNIFIAIGIYIFSIIFISIAFEKSSDWLFISENWKIIKLIFYGIYAVSIFTGVSHWPFSSALIATFSAVVFSKIFENASYDLLEPIENVSPYSTTMGASISIFFAMIVLLIAPPKSFAKRLVFIIVGLIILLSLNYFSIYQPSLIPPKL